MTHQNPHWHAPNTIKIVDLAKENSVNCAASLSRHDDDLNQMACHYDNLLGKNWLKLFFLPLSDVFYNVFGSLSRLMIIVFVSCFAPSQPSLETLPAQMISSNIPRYTKWTLMFDDMKTKKREKAGLFAEINLECFTTEASLYFTMALLTFRLPLEHS